MQNDDLHLIAAIERVTGMLQAKKKVWAPESPTFENFDIAQEFGTHPITFGLLMCGLKLNRIKKRFSDTFNSGRDFTALANDPDFEDSLIDLASYATLTLGMAYRERYDSMDDMLLNPEVHDRSDITDDAIMEAWRAKMGDVAMDDPAFMDFVKARVDAYIKTPQGQADIAELARQLATDAAQDTEVEVEVEQEGSLPGQDQSLIFIDGPVDGVRGMMGGTNDDDLEDREAA